MKRKMDSTISSATTKAAKNILKLDLGCGPNKKAPDFIGCDIIKFKGVDKVFDISKGKWPFKDGTVDEAHASHFLEHLTAEQRIHFANELFRVLKKGAKAEIITPHWNSNRAYGDPTHQWPPVAEFWFYYLKKEWRDANAPHTDKKHWPKGFNCDFDATWGYNMHPSLHTRNEEYKMFALTHYREAAQDMIATLIKR